MPAKFTVTRDKAGKFRFALLAPNGQVVATSQGYATKAAALNGVASVRKNAADAWLDDTTRPPKTLRVRPAAVKAAPVKAAPVKAAPVKAAPKPIGAKKQVAATRQITAPRPAAKTVIAAPTPARRSAARSPKS